MFLMYADEADQDGSKEFLVYAAVFIPADKALRIHLEIDKLRTESGFSPTDTLKFSSGTKPKDITREAHTDIKNKVLDLAVDSGCKTCCYVVPYAIAKGQPLENRLKFGINTILAKFDQFLRESGNAAGLAHFDRTEDFKQSKYFREVFELGLEWPDGKRKKFQNIVGINQASNGLSHLCSLCDIVVGAYRFSINEPDKDVVGAKLIQVLARMMWGVIGSDGELQVRERGICIRPKNVKLSDYQADIEAFISRLQRYERDIE